ncbi:uncharacterized protein (DUF885 family) [Granulicella aggregans]|uniref:Uncharacterized protein (DUF885 family) n=1 Tax=Granulicella aggregans TaxID=474949 RepID=A0A7W8E507_9BACT|nr:DUF885 domain-containing protein [Granulicella aggregans]MBB5059192.1 uncharacterized protein (DUF885 family) [Granulicella aggregans]
MRRVFPLLMLAATTVAASAQQAVPDKSWIKQSNVWTQMLLDVQLEHSPEGGSAEGLVKFDKRISDPTLADEKAARRETESVLKKIEAQHAKETNKQVAQDLEILRKAVDLQFRQQDFGEAHDVPFINASESVFGGLKTLLDDQVKAERRPDAVIRLRKYAGTEPGYKPFTDLLKQREIEQMAKPGVLYPSKGEIETEMGRDSNYVDGIADLFKKYKLTGWEEPYAKLKVELTEYDAWIRANMLPKARTDFRLAPEEYALAFEGYGIDIPPAQLAAMAHAAFTQIQGEMAPLAAEIAKKNGYPSSDYRAVIAEMKKKQITGEAILPFFTERLHEIEKIIVAQNLVTLPDRPAIIRLATAAETAQQPAPHALGPAYLNNTGERGEFVLPLNIPSATGGEADKYDDFTYDAASWTLTAHEARPGHELQGDSMLEHGVSLARVEYAFNSTNVEGWGLYSEYIMQPYEPVEGQLITLQFRLQRAARAFLDSELQSGKVTPEQVYVVLEKDVVLSHALAKEEVERYTYRMPGQANSYFYGYVKLLALRKDTEAALGAKFDQKKFHDFILDQGLLPPDLMRKAVMEDFVPRQK